MAAVMRALLITLLLTNGTTFAWGVRGIFDRPSAHLKKRWLSAIKWGTFATVISLAAGIYHSADDHVIRLALASGATLASQALFWVCAWQARGRTFALAFDLVAPKLLVTKGPYKWIRHPFYASYLLTYLAAWFGTLNLALLIPLSFMAWLYWRAARIEEKKYLDSSYREVFLTWAKSTGMFVPDPFKILSTIVRSPACLSGIERLLNLVFPTLALQKTPWLLLWIQKERNIISLTTRVMCFVLIAGLIGHHYFVDVPLGLASQPRWQWFRFGISALASLAVVTTFLPFYKTMVFYRMPLFIVSLVLCVVEAAATTWYSGVSYIYPIVMTVICCVSLQDTPSKSLGFVGVTFACEWIFLSQLSVGSAVVGSAMALSIGSVFMLRTRMFADIEIFLTRHDLGDANGKLIEANKQLTALDEAKNDFFANINHELRTPLTLILAPLDSLLEKRQIFEADTVHRLDICRRNALRLLRMVDELLDLAKLEGGGGNLRTRNFSLTALLGEVVEQVVPLAARKNIEVKLLELESDIVIVGDDAALEKVVLNILSNAVKFTPSGGKVSINVARARQGVEVAIADTGTGISQTDLGKIFERFYQADASSTRRHGGTGIGLSLSKRLVELHGGSISASSKLGEGTRIAFWLPQVAGEAQRSVSAAPALVESLAVGPDWHDALRRSREYRLLGIDDSTLQAANSREAVVPPSMMPQPSAAMAAGKATILIVDDNSEMVSFITSLMHTEFDIRTAPDGAAGLASALAFGPDLIISDVMMPVMTGLDLAKALRATAATEHIPVILLTARGETSDRIAGRSAGADLYLVKPFLPNELSNAVASLLQRRHQMTLAVRGERDMSLRTLAEGFAHEILNPLGFTKNALWAMRESVEEILSQVGDSYPRAAEAKQEVESLFRAGTTGISRASALVAELRTFSRNGDRAHVQAVSIGDIVDSVLTLTSVAKNVSARGEVNHRVKVRPGSVEQVLLNLVTNAEQAIGPHGKILIEMQDDPGAKGVIVSVHDDGPGIAPADLENIFHPFFTTKAEGTGLGLAISRQIIREYGGQLSVRSEQGRGATFRIWLPVD